MRVVKKIVHAEEKDEMGAGKGGIAGLGGFGERFFLERGAKAGRQLRD
jgi:hypothetical protein